MAQPKFTLSKYIKLADCSGRYCKAAFYSNGKIKPTRCIIGGKEEEHPEGSYFLYHKKSWIPVGADALDAQRRRNAQLDNYELKRLPERSNVRKEKDLYVGDDKFGEVVEIDRVRGIVDVKKTKKSTELHPPTVYMRGLAGIGGARGESTSGLRDVRFTLFHTPLQVGG